MLITMRFSAMEQRNKIIDNTNIIQNMSQLPVYAFAKWQVKEDQLSAVLSLLAEVAKKSIEEKGNLFYKIHQSNSEANTLILFEGYRDEAAVEEHRNSVHFQNLVIRQIVPRLEHREVMLVSQINPDQQMVDTNGMAG